MSNQQFLSDQQFYGLVVSMILVGIIVGWAIVFAVKRALGEIKSAADLQVLSANLHDAEIKSALSGLAAQIQSALTEVIKHSHKAGQDGTVAPATPSIVVSLPQSTGGPS